MVLNKNIKSMFKKNTCMIADKYENLKQKCFFKKVAKL